MKRYLALAACLIWLVSFPESSQAAQTSAYEHSLIGFVTGVRGVKITQASVKKSRSLGTLQPHERVIVDGKDQSNLWVHVESRLGSGYIPISALHVTTDLDRVPIVSGNLPVPVLPQALPVSDAAAYPILPTVTDFAREIYRQGLKQGNRTQVFSKVGDCMTADNHLFLGKFGGTDYELGEYGYLQDVIAYYSQTEPGQYKNAFEEPSKAAFTGFNSASVEDATWSDPAVCQDGESPLACEYRVSRSSIAIIMFGTNDITDLTSGQFDFYLRLVVFDTLSQGIVPLLSTFPGDPHYEEKTHQFNQIIFKVARDYDVPVMNLWLALQPLPGHGRNLKSMYLSRLESTQVSRFTAENLQYGYTLRNLLTLQALDRLWRGLER